MHPLGRIPVILGSTQTRRTSQKKTETVSSGLNSDTDLNRSDETRGNILLRSVIYGSQKQTSTGQYKHSSSNLVYLDSHHKNFFSKCLFFTDSDDFFWAYNNCVLIFQSKFETGGQQDFMSSWFVGFYSALV